MNRKIKARKIPVHLYPLITIIALVLVGIVLFSVSDPFITLIKPNFSGFKPENTAVAEPEGIVSELSVWLDMSPSMYGFLCRRITNCVPPSYRMVFSQLPTIAKAITKITTAKYYWFNSNYACLAVDTEEARTQERETHLADARQFGMWQQYQTGLEAGGSSVALPSVLNTLDLGKPSIILTDMEEDGLTQPESQYKLPLQRIFKAGYCVSIVAMKSAYGGILYNYTNEGIDYQYGNSWEKVIVKQLAKGNRYHSQPRNFYAIIVGTAEQCHTLRDAVTSAYQEQCKKQITDREAEIRTNDKREEVLSDFIALQTVDFWLNDNFATAYNIDGNSARVTDARGMTRTTDAPWADQGTLEYCVKKKNDGSIQTASLTVNIHPSMACYAYTYKTDEYAIPIPSATRIQATEVINGDLPESEAVLLARGERRVTLSLEPYLDPNQWFTCSPVAWNADGVTVTLNVQVDACEPGLYRLKVPVICRHSTESPELSDRSWVKDWTTPSVDLKNNMSKGLTADKTMNLDEMLETVHKSELQENILKEYLVAQLTVDLKIQ